MIEIVQQNAVNCKRGNLMDDNTITALIAGIAGLITIFFGRAYWASFRGLIDRNSSEVDRLRQRLEQMQNKMDQLETELHKVILERERLARTVEAYGYQVQTLITENEQLLEDNQTLRKQLGTT